MAGRIFNSLTDLKISENLFGNCQKNFFLNFLQKVEKKKTQKNRKKKQKTKKQRNKKKRNLIFKHQEIPTLWANATMRPKLAEVNH